MANSDRHLSDGKLVGIVFAAAVGFGIYSKTQSAALSAIAVSVAFIPTVVGSVLPDTDVKSSIPFRKAVKILSVAFVVYIIYITYSNWVLYLSLLRRWIGSLIPSSVPLSVIALILVCGVAYLVVDSIPTLIDKITGKHRGRTHNPVILLILFAAFAWVLWVKLPSLEVAGHQLRLLISTILPTALYLGTLTHIGRDKVS